MTAPLIPAFDLEALHIQTAELLPPATSHSPQGRRRFTDVSDPSGHISFLFTDGKNDSRLQDFLNFDMREENVWCWHKSQECLEAHY